MLNFTVVMKYSLLNIIKNIINYPFIDGLVDVTGGIAENWTLTLPEV
jgi:hypothetical protein